MAEDDAVLLTDALATGYFGAQLGDIVDGDTPSFHSDVIRTSKKDRGRSS
jgi:hypothetical protein